MLCIELFWGKRFVAVQLEFDESLTIDMRVK